MTRRRRTGAGRIRVRDDAGGVWIVTGWVLGLLVWGGVLLAWHAGFTPAAPFAVIPAILFILIGAGNLISGRPHRAPPRFNRPDLEPLITDAGPSPTADGSEDPGTGDPAGAP